MNIDFDQALCVEDLIRLGTRIRKEERENESNLAHDLLFLHTRCTYIPLTSNFDRFLYMHTHTQAAQFVTSEICHNAFEASSKDYARPVFSTNKQTYHDDYHLGEDRILSWERRAGK